MRKNNVKTTYVEGVPRVAGSLDDEVGDEWQGDVARVDDLVFEHERFGDGLVGDVIVVRLLGLFRLLLLLSDAGRGGYLHLLLRRFNVDFNLADLEGTRMGGRRTAA